MSDLADRRCKPCEGGVAPLDARRGAGAAARLDAGLDSSLTTRSSMRREFTFRDFYRTMSFVNALAHVANIEDHHPDLEVGYNYCRVRYTHARHRRAVGERLHLRRQDRSDSLAVPPAAARR